MAYRIRALREEPYSQKEAEAAVGLRTDNGKREIVEGESMEDISAPHHIMAGEGDQTTV